MLRMDISCKLYTISYSTTVHNVYTQNNVTVRRLYITHSINICNQLTRSQYVFVCIRTAKHSHKTIKQ